MKLSEWRIHFLDCLFILIMVPILLIALAFILFYVVVDHIFKDESRGGIR